MVKETLMSISMNNIELQQVEKKTPMAKPLLLPSMFLAAALCSIQKSPSSFFKFFSSVFMRPEKARLKSLCFLESAATFESG